MNLSSCPNCGSGRAGSQRFCPDCAFDYWKAAVQATDAPVPPVRQQPSPPSGGSSRLGTFLLVGVLIGGGVIFLQVVGSNSARGDAPARTERPTVTRTARPTPTATPDSGTVSMLLFTSHVARTSQEIAQGLQEVGDDATALDIDALTTSSVALWVRLGDEVDWLAANPPEACYVEYHADYSETIGALHHALDLISDGAIYQDVDLLNEGTAAMTAANAGINELADNVEAASAACGA